MKQSLTFGYRGIQISKMVQTVEGLEMQAKSVGDSALCPECGQSSFSVHTTYQRKLRDLPAWGIPTVLCLRVRKFFLL